MISGSQEPVTFEGGFLRVYDHICHFISRLRLAWVQIHGLVR